MLLIAMINEFYNSTIQSRLFARLAHDASFQIDDGASSRIMFPRHGPYDERLGYTALPRFTGLLRAQGYDIVRQARHSDGLLQLQRLGLFPPYFEKDRGGLSIFDQSGNLFFRSVYPAYVYDTLDEVPLLMVKTLLFVENRELLDRTSPTFNAAVEWDRFFLSALEFFGQRFIDDGDRTAGGSTLATQMAKFRHSPGGITYSGAEKLRQMASASLRMYLEGANSLQSRRDTVLSYINSVPLFAARGHGEVTGLANAMWVWYGVSTDATDAFLRMRPQEGSDFEAAQAMVYKQMLSLILAQRRPSYYLGAGIAALNDLTNVYLDLLYREGIISHSLYELGLPLKLAFRTPPPLMPRESGLLGRKTATAMRARLLKMLGMAHVYDLDKLDLDAITTIYRPLQNDVTAALGTLKSSEAAETAGLYGDRLLRKGDDLSRIIYSMSVYEKTGEANVIRAQTDNFDGPFNINEGVKLDLGSTAKLRTLATYLEIVAQLYSRYGALDRSQLEATAVDSSDRITQWALTYLAENEQRDLAAMLRAALGRSYSASPSERFFTGGGLHTFENFDARDDAKVMSVSEALNDSVNLVFVRLMRDIVRYYTFQVPGSTAQLLEDTKDERRVRYLARFADSEGKTFVERFYRKYRRKSPEEILAALIGPDTIKVSRMAVIYRSVYAAAGFGEFAGFILSYAPDVTDGKLKELYEKYDPSKLTLPDRGFLSQMHPLELWTAQYLVDNPAASASQVVVASTDLRQEVYRWLFSTRNKNVQDARIRQLLEVEAFLEIYKHWKSLRFPFDSMVASYASALGSSGDRPAALAELMGIIVNDGMYYPTVVFDELRFGVGTPYETGFVRRPVAGVRVMATEVAAALKHALQGVVEKGTARRVAGAFVEVSGKPIRVGGKTGTGDHRRERYSRGGAVLGSEVVNRTATFVFFLGDRYFGTISAFVPGKEAANYRFTSGLPVQLLKALAPILQTYLAPGEAEAATPPSVAGR